MTCWTIPESRIFATSCNAGIGSLHPGIGDLKDEIGICGLQAPCNLLGGAITEGLLRLTLVAPWEGTFVGDGRWRKIITKPLRQRKFHQIPEVINLKVKLLAQLSASVALKLDTTN